MPLLTVGRDLIAKMIRGAATTSEYWSSANARLVIGDSTETFASSQIDTGSSGANRFYKGMDASFPTSTADNVITWQMTATTSEANFAWNEWLIKNSSASSSGTMAALNRKQEALGTKTSAQSWALSAQVTITT